MGPSSRHLGLHVGVSLFLTSCIARVVNFMNTYLSSDCFYFGRLCRRVWLVSARMHSPLRAKCEVLYGRSMYDLPGLDMTVISADIASGLCEEILPTAQFVANLAFLMERTFCCPPLGSLNPSCLFFLLIIRVVHSFF